MGARSTQIVALARELGVQAVYANHDDDPYALARDAQVRGALAEAGIVLHTSKDHVVFERDEVLTAAGSPYSVFTPYKAAWLKKVDAAALADTRSRATRVRWRRCPPACRPGCRRWRASASRRPTCTSSSCRRAAAARSNCSTTSCSRASTATTRRATSRR